MRHFLATMILGSALFLGASAKSADAQIMIGGHTTYQVNNVYKPPGYYGTSWGVASYGTRRTYSQYSSPYGAGYSYGYAPAGILPGKYGTGLWRQTTTSHGVIYGAPAGYATYAKPFRAVNAVPGPPMGAYAPGFGPGLPPIIVGN